MQWMDGTGHMLWNGSEEDRNVRSEWEEDEGTDCEDGYSDTWLIMVDRNWHALYIKCMKSNNKIFFLSRCFIF